MVFSSVCMSDLSVYTTVKNAVRLRRTAFSGGSGCVLLRTMGSKQRCKKRFWKRRKLRKRQKKRGRNPDGTYKRPEVTGGQIIPPALVENQTAEYGPDSSSESAAQDENNNDISGLQGTALPRQKSSSQTAEHGRMRAAVPRQQLSSQTAEHGRMRAAVCNFRPRIRPIFSDAGAGSSIRPTINPDDNDSSLVLLPDNNKKK